MAKLTDPSDWHHWGDWERRSFNIHNRAHSFEFKVQHRHLIPIMPHSFQQKKGETSSFCFWTGHVKCLEQWQYLKLMTEGLTNRSFKIVFNELDTIFYVALESQGKTYHFSLCNKCIVKQRFMNWAWLFSRNMSFSFIQHQHILFCDIISGIDFLLKSWNSTKAINLPSYYKEDYRNMGDISTTHPPPTPQ